jgi:hypothetical protein
MAASTEPVAVTAALAEATRSVLAVLVLLNVVDLTEDQLAGIIVAVNAVLAIPTVLFVRSKVTPNARVDAVAAAHALQRPPVTPPPLD